MAKIKILAGWVSFISFFFALGVIGSLEMNTLRFGAGVTYILIAGIVGTLSGLIGFRRGD